jgi:hypothetical protein
LECLGHERECETRVLREDEHVWSLGDTKHSKKNLNVLFTILAAHEGKKEDYSKVECSVDGSFQMGTCIKGATREKY